MSIPVSSAGGVRVRVTRDLGLFDVTMAAVGTMVGAAIFLLVGATFTVAGPLSLGSVVLAAGVALLAGSAYAELAPRRADASGGAYAWVKAALPAPSGFLAGWLSWGGSMATAALSALGLSLFLLEWIRPWTSGGFDGPLVVTALGAAVLVLASLFHIARFHLSRRALGRLTLSRILLLLAISVVGLISLPSVDRVVPPGAPSSLGLALGAGVFFVAFQGFEAVAQLSDQTKRPERTVPRGTFLAVGMTSLVYVLVFLALLANAPERLLAGWPACGACGTASESLSFASVANFPLGQPWIREAFFLTGVLSMYAALSTSLTSAVRTSVSMARDGLLPPALARVAGREIPPFALWVTAAGSAALLPLRLETVAILGGLSYLGLFAFVHASVISLRRREGPGPQGFRVPLVPFLPLFGIALNFVLGVVLWNFPTPSSVGLRTPAGELATYLGALWLASGLMYHYFAGGRESLRRAALGPRADVTSVLMTAEERIELDRYRVFLPLREFTDTDLVEFGARVARAHGGELSLLNVVEIPPNLPPKAIRFRYVDERIRGLQRLARIAEALGVDTRPVVKIGYKVYEIILDTVEEEAVNLLVLGWRGSRAPGDRRILGSNIDYLIENAPCDVVVFKTRGLTRPLRRIVILTSPIWSVAGIDDLALILAAEDRPEIRVVSLVGDPDEAERVKRDAAPFLERCQARGLVVEHRILYSRAWESVALQESAKASVLMIRATSPGGIRKFALSPVEDRIVKLAKCPVLILRKGVA